MRKLYEVVIKHRKKVIALFILAAIISVFELRMVAVDYDMNDYLPAESPSTIAIDVMEQEFTGGIPNARVMVRGVTIPQALELKAEIAAAKGVTGVTWLDDSVDITMPTSWRKPVWRTIRTTRSSFRRPSRKAIMYKMREPWIPGLAHGYGRFPCSTALSIRTTKRSTITTPPQTS